MKKLLLIALCILSLSCSKDEDCTNTRASINEQYDDFVQQVIDNPLPSGEINYAQIQHLETERDNKLAGACD